VTELQFSDIRTGKGKAAASPGILLGRPGYRQDSGRRYQGRSRTKTRFCTRQELPLALTVLGPNQRPWSN